MGANTKKEIIATKAGKLAQMLPTIQALTQSLCTAEYTLIWAWEEQCIFSNYNLSSKTSADLIKNTIRGINTITWAFITC